MPGLLGGSLWVAVLVAGASAQLCSRDGEDQQYPTYRQPLVRRVQRSEDGLQPLYRFARSFLRAVQPHAFPADLLARVLKNGTEDKDIAELVHYEAGYLVCLFLAVLFVLFMPITGALLLWMHHHRQSWLGRADPTSPSRYRRDLAVSGGLVLTALLLCIGVILAFAVNNRTTANMGPSLLQLQSNADTIERNLASVPQGMKSVVEQYSIPKAAISRSINEMNDAVGGTTITYFRSPFQNALADFSTVVEDASRTSETLQSMEDLRGSLQRRQEDLQTGLTRLRTRLKNLEESCSSCQHPNTSDLEMVANYSLIPSVQNKLDSIPPREKFKLHVQQSNQTFHSIPQICSQQLEPTTAALLSELNATEVLLRNNSQGLPSLLSLRQASSDLRTSVRNLRDPLGRYDHARWAVAITLCFVLLVTVVFLLAALSIGLPVLVNPAVYSSYPHARLERTALWMFQICILLICAFSWLFIILVFITLFFGGNAHTLLCQSFTSGEIFSFMDRQDLFTSLADAHENQSSLVPPRSSNVYHGCRRGESLFHSMEMDQIFDLEEFLDPMKYFAGFNDTIGDISVSTERLQLLSDAAEQDLLKYRRVGLENYSYDNVTRLLEAPVMKQSLSDFAKDLDQKATQTENKEIKEPLKDAADEARRLHQLEDAQKTDAANMSGSVKTLKNISQSYKENVDVTLSSFNRTQGAMNTQVPLITANVSQCTLQNGEEQLLRYLDWARHSIVDDLLSCGWLARSLDNMYIAVCLNVVDPWNGFWLSLGWCCAFLVPALFLSLYVAKCLLPHPAIPPRAFPAFTDHSYPDASSLKKEQYTEKNGDGNKSEEKSEPNVYMTLSELGDLNS